MSVIIVGGGMTGAILALTISHLTKNSQLPINLVEAVNPKCTTHSDYNTYIGIALAQSTCQHLTSIGVWQKIVECATPIKTIHVSDLGRFGFVTISAQDYNIDALGQVVEMHEIRIRLFNLLKEAPGITLYCPARVIDVIRSKSSVSVKLDNNNFIEAQLIIAADGSLSTLASQCGIEWYRQPYFQIAVNTNIETTLNHEGQAWEIFTEYGPLAILPILEGRCSIVWCHPFYNRNKVMSWSDKHFCSELQRVFGWRLGRITCVSKRFAYPLNLINAIQSITHRIVLVGNAAQTLHPVAGQGFNLGLRDIINLAEMLSYAHSKKQDYGAYSLLNRYQQKRKLDKAATINMTNSLAILFSNRWIPLVIGRNIGMIAMELFSPARDMLVNNTLGEIIC